MIIRITTAISNKTNIFPETSLPLNANPFCDWSVQGFKINRYEFLLITNSCSLYSVISDAKGIKEIKKFTQKIQNSIQKQLSADNLEDYYVDFIEPYWDDILFLKSLDKYTTSYMQSIIKKIKTLGERGVDLDELSKIASSYPIKSKDFREPIEIFRDMKPDK